MGPACVTAPLKCVGGRIGRKYGVGADLRPRNTKSTLAVGHGRSLGHPSDQVRSLANGVKRLSAIGLLEITSFHLPYECEVSRVHNSCFAWALRVISPGGAGP